MRIVMKFTGWYIAEPYTVERYRLIEIQKISGMNKAKSENTRNKALESYLKTLNMTLKDYQDLEKKANTPFLFDGSGNIWIPDDRVASCLVNAVAEGPARLKVNNIRASLKITGFTTDRQKPDGVWERFVVVNSGYGKLSNQRSYRASWYIDKATATGEINFDPGKVKPNSIVELLKFAGSEVGIGASRKMGHGRFTVETDL